jgi:hypothetical protein
MIGDAIEHICSGCYEVIASHDPEAYQRGTFYYHSKSHEDRHVSRNAKALLNAEVEHSQEVFRELTLRPF